MRFVMVNIMLILAIYTKPHSNNENAVIKYCGEIKSLLDQRHLATRLSAYLLKSIIENILTKNIITKIPLIFKNYYIFCISLYSVFSTNFFGKF